MKRMEAEHGVSRGLARDEDLGPIIPVEIGQRGRGEAGGAEVGRVAPRLPQDDRPSGQRGAIPAPREQRVDALLIVLPHGVAAHDHLDRPIAIPVP